MSSPVNHTSVDPQTLARTAKRIGQLMDDMSTFDKLAEAPPLRAGNFDTATWLRVIIRDRCAGVIAHAHDLKTAFGDIQRSLEAVARDLRTTDANSGTDLRRQVTHDTAVMRYNVAHDAPGVSPGVHNLTAPVEPNSTSHPVITSGKSGQPPTDPTDGIIGVAMENALAHRQQHPAP
jgi:hypothetical protein